MSLGKEIKDYFDGNRQIKDYFDVDKNQKKGARHPAGPQPVHPHLQ